MSTALILLGHGSHISPNTAAVVWEAVDALRALGIADEITAGFWKEMPSFSRVLHTVTADDITLLPMFTAQGYFTRQVIPGEMGFSLTPPLMMERGAGGEVRVTRTLGEHPRVAEIIQARARDAITQNGLARDDVALVVVGHGTKNNPTSRVATESQADLLRDHHLAREVVAVYLDDDPDIPTIYESTSAPVIVVIPYFLAAGSHTTLDVPGELGLEHGEIDAVIRGRRVIYTPPIGANGGLTDILLSLIAESGANLSVRPVASVWDGFPVAGRDIVLAAIAESGTLKFGALTVTSGEVRCGDGHPLPTLISPAQVRDAVRLNPFRPLATARQMPNAWRVELDKPQDAHAVIETVYPGMVADWAAERQGKLVPVTLPEVAARQKGMFRALENFSLSDEESLSESVCSLCVLSPRWTRISPFKRGDLPCAEPCNMLLSLAKEGVSR